MNTNTKHQIPLHLAPMAGAGDRAFRETCGLFGVDFFYTEMISAKAVLFGDKKTALLAEIGEEEHPCALQIFGNDPEGMAKAAAILSERFHPDEININFGCPVPKIVNNNEGSSLMKDPPLCGQIVTQVKKAVSVPVSVKIRAGWDSDQVNAGEVATICADAGASRIAVHGRTRCDFYRDGTVKLSVIEQVKKAVSIPVIGNGDIKDGPSAKEMLLTTGCDALMIGRAAVGAPWIFSKIRAELEGKEAPKINKKEIIAHHLSLAFQYKPKVAGREMRMHMSHYLKGFRGAAALRDEAGKAETEKDYLSLLKALPND